MRRATNWWDFYYGMKDEYPDTTWEFLEGEGRYNEVNRYDFLHGCCNLFSAVLHEQFGYDVFEVPDETGECPIAHSFCIDDKGNFIDIRGKIRNMWEFFDDFEDFVDIDNISSTMYKLSPEDIQNIFTEYQSVGSKYVSAAYRFVKEDKEMYA